MVQGDEDIGFPLKILYDGLAHQWITRLEDHFLHSHQLHRIWKMQVSGAVNRPHPTHANHFFDGVAVHQDGT